MKKYLVVALLLTGCAVQEAGAMQNKSQKVAYAFFKQNQKRYFGQKYIDNWNDIAAKTIFVCSLKAYVIGNSYASYKAGQSDGEHGGVLKGVYLKDTLEENFKHDFKYIASATSTLLGEVGLALFAPWNHPLLLYSALQIGFYGAGYHKGKKLKQENQKKSDK